MYLEAYNMWQQQQQHQQAYLRGMPPQHSQHPQHPQQQTLHPGIIGTDHNHATHQPHQQHHHQHHHATIMDLPVPSNPRASRNMAEKQRRDNLNANISTMATLVPNIAGSSRRMDKISILRLATAFLRTRYTLGSGSMSFPPPLFKNQFDLEQFFVDHLVDSGGFFLVLTVTGKIVYVSRQVEQHLGHVQNELLGQSLYNFVYPEDHDELTRNLTPDGMQPMSTPSPTGIAQVSDLTHDSSSSSSEELSATNHRTKEMTKRFREQRRHFKIRMAQRTNSRRDHMQYECFDISGLLRLAEACRHADTNGNRGRQRETTGTSNDIVFVGVATPPKKRSITELSILDANKDEYVTRHLVDGRIIYCDHRVSVVAGYMSEEVSGLNAFAFMHRDDFRWTMIGLRQMYDRAETCGSSCYRLCTKTGNFIYLRTYGYLEFDKDTQTVESFVCVNTLLSEEEGIQCIKEMKIRFSATVTGNGRDLIQNTDSMQVDVSNREMMSPRLNLGDPNQLKVAITSLISNLPSPTPVLTEDRFSPSPLPNAQFAKAAAYSANLPPAAIQVSKIAHNMSNKTNHGAISQSNETLKQESNHMDGKSIDSAEQSPMSDSESGYSDSMSSGKPLSMSEMINATSNTDVSEKSKNFTARKSSKRSRVPRNRTACSQSAKILNAQERIDQRNVGMLSPKALNESTICDIKMEHGIQETFDYIEKQGPRRYLDDSPSASDSSIVSSGLEVHNPCSLKRMCSDEDLMAIQTKRRPNDAYAPTSVNSEHQCYLKCRSFAAEYPTFSNEFNQYNDVNSQPLTIAESPNSSLHEAGTDYQQLVNSAMPLPVVNHDEFLELQDLQEDTLRSSDTNPELMNIFDGLHNGSTGFETFNNAKTTIQQLTPNNQVMNDELSCTYYQLADNMMLHESQINVLARDLKSPVLCAQRGNLPQTEHNVQKKMLKSLQHEHCKVRVNKQKFGI